MGKLTHLQTISQSWLSAMGQSTVLRVSGPADDRQISLYDVSTRSEDSLDLTRETLRLSDITSSTRADTATGDISMNDTTHILDTATLSALAQDSSSTQAYLDGIGFYGLKTVLHSYEVSGQDYLVAARPGGEGASLYTLSNSGTPRLVQTLQDDDSTDLLGITAMASTQIGGQTYVVAAAGRDNGISVLRHNANTNRLEIAHDFGFADKLPVTGPSALEIVTVDGQPLVLMGAFDTGSLTVLSLSGDGRLGFVDQVNDTLDTRFDGTAALATYSAGEIHLVAVGGNDGGISLFQILPNGRLVLRETLVDTLDTGLASVQQLIFVETSERIELVVLSARDQAITRYALDPDALGITATGTDGSARSDVLTASDAGGTLRGNAGDDVMIDGAGQDVFYGGTGEDVFVFTSDDTRDTIQDFAPNTDKIDLSSYAAVSSIDDVQLRSTSGGVRVFIDDEELRVLSSDGSRLTADQLEGAILFASDHVIIPEALTQIGSNQNETFVSGLHADTIDGGAGYDTLSFSTAPAGATVDLSGNTANAGIAAGYVLTSIEGVIGTIFDDHLIGDSGRNVLRGMWGEDALYGNAGVDQLYGGGSDDFLDGGAGWDVALFDEDASAYTITIVGQTTYVDRIASGGEGTDTLVNIEALQFSDTTIYL